MRIYLLTLLLMFFSSNVFAFSPDPVIGTIEFRVFAFGGSPIKGARVLVIGNDGKLLSTVLTNRSGSALVKVSVYPDPRFEGHKAMGTVSAITVANGYVEQVNFMIPVFKDGVQPVGLMPIKRRLGYRNEPDFQLGNIHRLDVFAFIDKYAKEASLKKQSSTNWSPDIDQDN